MSKTPKQIREEQLEVIRKTYPQKFGDYVDESVYYDNDVIPIEPMSAKEPLNEEQMEEMFHSKDYLFEEKKDGTRATLHIRRDGNRVFSRRISKKTNWYSENTDSLPHIRDIKVPIALRGTILDGELSIPGGEFKDIASIMNCLYDEAILRQQETDKWVVLNVFDIIYYKGVYVAKLPLLKRKELMRKVIEQINSPYIREEKWYHNENPTINVDYKLLDTLVLQDKESTYPNLFKEVYAHIDMEALHEYPMEYNFNLEISPKAFYEYVILNGGEGLMMKPVDGTYRHTRGREYTKIKKFTTRECILMGFNSPTERYDGKERDTWQYWGMYRQGKLEEIIEGEEPSPWTRDHHVEPVTKHFAKDWIGTILYGVIITAQELKEWQKANPKEKAWVTMLNGRQILIVGECSGIDEEMRDYMTKNQCDLIGKVIELKCHEVLKTGKLRHPRFLRFREDKEMTRCVYKDHMEGVK